MHRREFIITSLLSLPAFACSPVRRLGSTPSKAFVVKAGESRFGVPTPFLGVNPNDLKISTKDTGGLLSAFDYTGVQQTTCISGKTRYSSCWKANMCSRWAKRNNCSRRAI
jgi:hypothetical protein